MSKGITKCTGVITDGDLAVRWEQSDRVLAGHRSVSLSIVPPGRGSSKIVLALSSKGTLPFMAVRLLDEWNGPACRGARFTHTAIDDLESFLWILFWVPLEVQHIKCDMNKHITCDIDKQVKCDENKPIKCDKNKDVKRDKHIHDESAWRRILNSAVIDVQSAKNDLVSKLSLAIKFKKPLGYIRLCHHLIEEWHKIAVQGRHEVEALLDKPDKLDLDFHKKYYQRYLDTGFECLGSLPDTWDV